MHLLLLASCATFHHSARLDGTELLIGHRPEGRRYACEGDELLVLEPSSPPALFVGSQDLRVTNHEPAPWGDRFFAHRGAYGIEYRVPSDPGEPARIRLHVLLPTAVSGLSGDATALTGDGRMPASERSVIATDLCWPEGAAPGPALYGPGTSTTPPQPEPPAPGTHRIGLCAVRADPAPDYSPSIFQAIAGGLPYQYLSPLPPYVTLGADGVRFTRVDGSSIASSERVAIGDWTGFRLERAESSWLVTTEPPLRLLGAPLGRAHDPPTPEDFRVVCPLE